MVERSEKKCLETKKLDFTAKKNTPSVQRKAVIKGKFID